MKHSLIRTILVAGACAPFALPAAANAGMSDVNEHLDKADSALERAEGLVSKSNDATAAVKMARANVQAAKAARDARQTSGAERRSRAQNKVARQYDQNSDTFAELVGDVRGSVQDDVAEEITEAISGRDRAVAKLTELLDRVPEQAVPAISKAIAKVAQGGKDEVTDLVESLGSGEIRPGAREAVGAALDKARASVEAGLAHLQGIVDSLPAQAQSHVQSAIDRVTNQVGSVFDLIGGLLGGGGKIPPLPFNQG